MDYKLKELLDVPKLQELLNSLAAVHSLPSAIIDNEGNLLTATAWQDICTKFHRVNPDTENKCIESDLHIGAKLTENMSHFIYRCPMGLVDTATPIIVDGKHLGNVFTGQLFLEPPDESYFKKQAHQYGFDEQEYMAAMRQVPLCTEEQLHNNLSFIAKFTQMLAEQALVNKRLRESEERYRIILQAAIDGVWLVDTRGRILEVNESYCRMSGYGEQELLMLNILDLDAIETADDIAIRIQRIMELGDERFTSKHRRKDGSLFDVEVSVQYRYVNSGQFVCFIQDISEKKLAENALQASEQRYRTVANFTHDWEYWLTPDSSFAYCSPSCEQITGYSAEEFMNDPNLIKAIIHPDDFAITSHHFNEIGKQDSRSHEREFRIINRSGEVRWIAHACRVVIGDDGKYLGRRASNRDVTSRKKAEEDYRLLFNKMLDGFALHEIICDEQGKPIDYRFLAINPAFEKLTGLKAEELVGRTVQEVMPGTEQHWIDIYGKVALTGEPANFENYSTELNRYFEVNAFRPAANQFACIFLDISERKLTESYKDMSRKVLMLMNEQGGLKDIIPKVITILKTETGFDAVGIRLQVGDDYPYFSEEGFPNELLLKENSLIERNREGGVCRDKDGNVCLECTCGLVITGKSEPGHPLFTPGGSFWTNDSFPLLGLPHDVDPRLNPRNECIHHNYASVALVPIRDENRIVGLIQFNGYRKDMLTLNSLELLEGVAGHIGAALMQKRHEDEKHTLEAQLQHAQKIEAIGRLAGGVAHDFNNMLTIIMGHAQLGLMKIAPDSPIADDLNEIIKSSERSADLTRQLLAFARKQTVAPKVLDLNETVSGMLKMLQRLIGEDICLNWHPTPNLWEVKVDPSQIDQILANLCVNARDSIANVGKITIETGSNVIDEEYCSQNAGFMMGEYVRLAVSDDGCGMDKETMAQIFEPFFTTKGPGEGTGLGLATVYGIVRQNEGFINVYSEPGLGTTFTIYLPRYSGKVEKSQTIDTLEPFKRGKETILLVEDEPAILKITTMILRKQGYTILAANTPKEAIRLASEHADKIHLLMTDVVMPEMNGKELSKKLQSLYPQLKCLYMSGYTANVIANHGVLETGVNFIQKPYNMDTLADKLREVLDYKGLGD